MRRCITVVSAVLCLSCTGISSPDVAAPVFEVVETVGETVAEGEVRLEFDTTGVEVAGLDAGPAELWETDLVGSSCEAGEGCFLDKCEDNGDCQSGWCVDHLGEGVCSQLCQEECPPGWSCQQVAGTEPDVIYICISDYTNLCRPCRDGNDCKSEVGAEDVCVGYGSEGSFCGGACQQSSECPWGFSCQDVETVDGIVTSQCVVDAGVCPCTAKSVALSLWTSCDLENDWGMCSGKRVCTDEGLSDCDAQLPAQEECNGIDDDCDGETDEPILVEGDYTNVCDDGNPCTADACKGEEGCAVEILDAGECMDGDPCTIADHCATGVCVGKPVDCNDDNPCTQDICTEDGGCEALPAQGECDDGDPCTLGDHCVDEDCKGTGIPCDCQTDDDCAALEDGNLCNGTLQCDTTGLPYKCAVNKETIVVCPVPEGIEALCLEAYCEPATGACSMVATNAGNPCDDDDLCTWGDTCQDGVCAAGPALNCNDGNLCTDDSCDPLAGCQNADNDAPCSDGDLCTDDDICGGGECQPGAEVVCDDGNDCTDDSCISESGCQHAPNQAECDDGNACTSGDKCTGGQCVFLAVLSCDDGNACTADSCDSTTGCANEPAPGTCDDGNPCTLSDLCVNGACQPGPPVSCDDGNSCTADACDEEGVCQHDPAPGQCSDGNECTTGDHCESGVCVTTGETQCADDDPCTDEHCDSALGCVSTLNSAPCDDNDLCTTGDHCHLGQCISSGGVACDDGNDCTNDSCLPASGCQFAPNQEQCDDGNECTAQDTCSSGKCVGQGYPDCDDTDTCTSDACDPATGCVHGPLDGPACEDGDLCTLGDKCVAGSCEAGVEIACDDGNECTQEECDPAQGCVATDLSGTPCDDEDNCTEGDECLNGECNSGEQMDCEDSNVCTDDLCVPGVGCMHSNNSDPCDDGVLCTTGDFCAGGLCQPGNGAYDCDDDNECTQDSCDPDDNECKNDNVTNATLCDNGSKWCWNGACVDTQPGTFCFTGPEKAYMSGNQICADIFGLPCGPAATKTYHADNCTGSTIDSGRGCSEMPLDPYNAGSALLVCGQ